MGTGSWGVLTRRVECSRAHSVTGGPLRACSEAPGQGAMRRVPPAQTGLHPGGVLLRGRWGWSTPWTPASLVFPGKPIFQISQISEPFVAFLKGKDTPSVVNQALTLPRGGRRAVSVDRSRAPLDGGDTSGNVGG